MFVCICHSITESAVGRAGRAGLVRPEQLIDMFELNDSTGCGQCIDFIDEFVTLAEAGQSQALAELSLQRSLAPVVAR
jgi:bacterioferritin-associated ferredoxin